MHVIRVKVNADLDTAVWDSRGRQLMTCQLHPRIGNMLFAYASLVGISRRNGRIPALPAGHFLRSMFRLRAAYLPDNYHHQDERQNTVIHEKKAGVYDDETELINSENRVVELAGYFQSWKYFARVVEEVFMI